MSEEVLQKQITATIRLVLGKPAQTRQMENVRKRTFQEHRPGRASQGDFPGLEQAHNQVGQGRMASKPCRGCGSVAIVGSYRVRPSIAPAP